MKPKGKQSVRSAVEGVYNSMPRHQKFSLMEIHTSVVRTIRRPFLYLDTTRRKLFELREEGIAEFECIDKAKSLYKKL